MKRIEESNLTVHRYGITLCGILCVILCVGAHAYTYEPHWPLAPAALTYSCPDSQVRAVSTALTIWNAALDGRFALTRVPAGGYLQYRIDDGQGSINGAPVLGETWPEGDHIAIALTSVNAGPYAVALHETGHALGLGHSTDPHSIMQPVFQAQLFIDQDDIDGIRELYDLSPKTLDFAVRRTRNAVTCYTLNKQPGQWLFNGMGVSKKQFQINRFTGGTISLIQNGLACFKFVP